MQSIGPACRPAGGANISQLCDAPGLSPAGRHGFAGDIARFRAVQDNDLATGHVNQSVYTRIKGEVDQAAATCAAGNEGGARSALAAIKKRHGYPG